MDNIEIRLCKKGDSLLLEKLMPSRESTNFQEGRYRKQLEGISSYLIAWKDGEPVGHLNILWQGPKPEETIGLPAGIF